MTTMEGRCDICGKKVVVETLDDKTEYLHWGDQIKEGCRHYPKGGFISESKGDYLKLELKLSEYEKRQRECHRAYLEDILKGNVKTVRLDDMLDKAEFCEKHHKICPHCGRVLENIKKETAAEK